jgi:thiamine biosynthesis protein ThiS
MNLVINGDPRELLRSSSAAEMLAELGLDPRAVVVELNRTIIRRAALAETPIADGDVVEIVHFVGGG